MPERCVERVMWGQPACFLSRIERALKWGQLEIQMGKGR